MLYHPDFGFFHYAFVVIMFWCAGCLAVLGWLMLREGIRWLRRRRRFRRVLQRHYSRIG